MQFFYNKMFFNAFLQYILCICLVCFFVGCATSQKTTKQNQNPTIYDSSEWKHITKQTLSDVEKSHRINLFNKCYYYENAEVCLKVLEPLKEECNEGIGLSCGLVAMAYMDARGVKKDLQQSFYLIQQGCYLEDSLSCLYMRKYYLANNHKKEANKILHSITQACSQGQAFECFLLSIIYENDIDFDKYTDKVVPYRKNACMKKIAMACGYIDNKEISKEEYQGYQKKACDLGMMFACDAFRESEELNIRTQHARLYRVW